ncbi:glutamine amidotransferase [candidate division KSB1 bacterium]|nr:glutamine amidotransferase [candidate division KSB1 bacterium]
MSKNKHIIIIKLGSTYPFLSREYGDFEDWIINQSGLEREKVDILKPYKGDKLPDPALYSGIILTGSHATIMDREEWSERTAAWIPKILEKKIPLLGICYGHQLIVHAMGGIVDNNPNGIEFGTVEITITEAAKMDPLFKNLPSKMFVHTGHTQSIVKLPQGAQILASSEMDPYTAFFLPPSAWGVQFHPEYNSTIVSGYVKEAGDVLKVEGQNADRIQAKIQSAPEAKNILKTFAEIVLRK